MSPTTKQFSNSVDNTKRMDEVQLRMNVYKKGGFEDSDEHFHDLRVEDENELVTGRLSEWWHRHFREIALSGS